MYNNDDTKDNSVLSLEALRQAVKTTFTPEYQAQTPEEVAIPDALGIQISRFFRWNGLAVLRVAFSALEDSNFHREAAAIGQMIEKIEGE